MVDWKVQLDKPLDLGFEGDNNVLTLEVVPTFEDSENWNLSVYVEKDNQANIIALQKIDSVYSVLLKADMLADDGIYYMQIRGDSGDKTKYSNKFYAIVHSSINASDMFPPKVPSEFTQIESDIKELNNHPPAPGQNGYWMIWNTVTDKYEESSIKVPVGPPGPKGDDGQPGEKGDKGDKGDPGESGVYYGSDQPVDQEIKVWVKPDGTETSIIPFIDLTAYGVSFGASGGDFALPQDVVNQLIDAAKFGLVNLKFGFDLGVSVPVVALFTGSNIEVMQVHQLSGKFLIDLNVGTTVEIFMVIRDDSTNLDVIVAVKTPSA